MSSSPPLKRRSWIPSKHAPSAASSGQMSGLEATVEGVEMQIPPRDPTASSPPATAPPLFQRTNSSGSLPGSSSRRSSLLTPIDQLDNEASRLILHALERTSSAQQNQQNQLSKADSRNTGSFGKISLSSMLSGLSLSRGSNDQDERGRSRDKAKGSTLRSSSAAPPEEEQGSRSRSRARSQSPFTFRRARNRDSSPTPQAIPLAQSDYESDGPAPMRPRTAFTDEDSGDEIGGTEETEDEEWSSDDWDPETEANTERNAVVIAPGTTAEAEVEVDADPLGEGVNVVVPPEPYFGPGLAGSSGTTRGKRNPRRRKSLRHHEPLRLQTSRPVFQRDRCTLTLTQGDPDGTLGTRRRKRYVVASDLSVESRYALEWGIGTVMRDGDEMLIVTVQENESKIDPPIPNAADRATKLRSQQERQGLAYILCRQATSLLQRTKLNVSVSCQAWHTKNARHMLLDIIDYTEPAMLIVGSRGLGQLQGILLGSTSHYLLEKCSVPVMVARRRLKRPPRRSAHLVNREGRAHVSLAEAGIDRVATKVADAQTMRAELEREDDEREPGHVAIEEEKEDESSDSDGRGDDEGDGDHPEARKVAGD